MIHLLFHLANGETQTCFIPMRLYDYVLQEAEKRSDIVKYVEVLFVHENMMGGL